VSEMQTLFASCDRGPGTLATASPPRLLEDPDGVVRLYSGEEVVAHVQGGVTKTQCIHDKVEWMHWYLEGLYWERLYALRMLQGASLQQLVGSRYVIVRCKTTPIYAVRPRLEALEMAELVATSRRLSHRELYDLVHAALSPPSSVV